MPILHIPKTNYFQRKSPIFYFQDKTLNMSSESLKVLQNEKGGYRFPPENSGFGLCKVAQIISEGDNGGGPRRVSRRYVRGPPLSR